MNCGINKQMKYISATTNTILVFILLIVFCHTAKATDPPFTVKADLFDQTNIVNLDLDIAEDTETITVFAPSDSTDKFIKGVVLKEFKTINYDTTSYFGIRFLT